jgi:hypothetical protein
MKYFAGIGSRETPNGVKPMIEEVCSMLYKNNFVLRSGGAPGADLMFESSFEGEKEIYLPWKGFNQNVSNLFLDRFEQKIVLEARELAKKHHPNWTGLSGSAKDLMTRNSFQVLGQDLSTPVDFIVCWTQGGLIKGGTGQAMRIAKNLGIPIFNLYDKDCLHKLRIFLSSI